MFCAMYVYMCLKRNLSTCLKYELSPWNNLLFAKLRMMSRLVFKGTMIQIPNIYMPLRAMVYTLKYVIGKSENNFISSSIFAFV